MSIASAVTVSGPAASKPPAGAYFYMDAMRAILALVVGFGHAWALLVRDYQAPASLFIQFCYFASGFGHSAVILFFVLSGFWIARSVVQNGEHGWSWSKHLVDRISRLMLVLIPALLLGGLLDAFGVFVLRTPTHLGLTETYVLNKDVAADLGLPTLLANLAFLQVVTHTFGSNGPLWSLGYEFWFYIWFPALWLAIRYRKFSIGLVALAFAWFNPDLGFSFLSWLAGAGLYFVDRRLEGRTAPTGTRHWAGLGCTALIFLAALFWSRTGSFRLEDPVLALSFALFLLALLRADPHPAPAVRPVAHYGAAASFSYYAIHFPILVFLAGILVGRDRLAPDAGSVGLVAAALLFTVAMAWAFARQTEARTGSLRNFLYRFLPNPVMR